MKFSAYSWDFLDLCGDKRPYIAPYLATTAFISLTPDGIPHSMTRLWGYPTQQVKKQGPRTMHSEGAHLSRLVPRKRPLEASLSILTAQ